MNRQSLKPGTKVKISDPLLFRLQLDNAGKQRALELFCLCLTANMGAV
ncbi:13257_t:CDS:2 [Funneliformis caledonium]|uniref:13257_t:CDS:1 n=1 Tax=Funneliformis caledonium TaxID=1117310 RepID=A0A9N8VH38_9GLOM|nr:13257_t:CDS:2 [Funneliformis caledonium]